MSKNAPKSLVVCPEISSSRKGTVSVSPNSDGTAFVVTIKMLVGAPVTRKSKKGKEYTQSGVLSFDESIVEINGVSHRISLNSGWYEGRRVGNPEIVFKPVEETESTTVETVEIPF